MRKLLLTALLASSFTVSARLEKSPTELWTLPITTMTTTITVITVEGNIDTECNKYSQKAGFGKYKYTVAGCAFWSLSPEVNTCTILVSKKTNNDTIGHEFRHCLQGEFH